MSTGDVLNTSGILQVNQTTFIFEDTTCGLNTSGILQAFTDSDFNLDEKVEK